MKVPFKKSKYAGKELHECPLDYLMWIARELDVTHNTFGASNQKLVDEANRIINMRADVGKPHKNAATGSAKSKTEHPSNVLKELSNHIKCIYDAAVLARATIDVYDSNGNLSNQEDDHQPF